MAAGDSGLTRVSREGRPSPTAWFALFAMLGFFAWTGLRGIDFGHHWDEYQHLNRIARYMTRGVLQQEDYNYPSLTVRLLAFALLPERAHGMATDGLREVIASPAFNLRGRALFLLVSSLVGVWVFLAVWLLSGSSLWAVVGAGVISTSWEIAYHARWIASDTLVVQFAMLAQLLALVAVRCGGLLPLVGAAAAAGLACSAKWTGGVVLLSVLPAAVFAGGGSAPPPGRSVLATRAARALAVGSVFAAVVLFVTPALYVEPMRVIESLREQIQIYGEQGHFGYGTNGFVDHLGLLAAYYVGAAASPWWPASVVLSALAVTGAVAWARSPRETAVLLLAPLAFCLYMASQRVMIVRNVLLVLPAGAILAALGGRALAQRLSRGRAAAAAWVVPAACLAIVASNAAWLQYASSTIRNYPRVDALGELVHWVDAHPGRVVHASVQLGRRLKQRFPERSFGSCASSAPSDALCAMLTSEAPSGPHRVLWPANRVRYRLLSSGPYEVNWNYYPTWDGPERIVLVRDEDVLRTSLREVVSRAW